MGSIGRARSEPADGPRDSELFLQSVARAIRVIEAYAQASRPLSLAEIAASSGIDKSGAQRVCHTLQALGYLERDPDGLGLVPGKAMLDRVFDYLRLNPLVQRATPVLIELRKSVQERVDLSLFDDTAIVYAIRLQSKRETFFSTLVGRRIPAIASAGGRAMLACLADAEVNAILRRSERRALTPKTLTAIPAIRDRIHEARALGFGFVQEEELLGEVAIGAAITDSAGRPVAAIHVAGSLSDWKPADFCKKIAPLVTEAAHALKG